METPQSYGNYVPKPSVTENNLSAKHGSTRANHYQYVSSKPRQKATFVEIISKEAFVDL